MAETCTKCGHAKDEHFQSAMGSFCKKCTIDDHVWEHVFDEVPAPATAPPSDILQRRIKANEWRPEVVPPAPATPEAPPRKCEYCGKATEMRIGLSLRGPMVCAECFDNRDEIRTKFTLDGKPIETITLPADSPVGAPRNKSAGMCDTHTGGPHPWEKACVNWSAGPMEAPRAAPQADFEHKYRELLWLSHGHGDLLYGDDGEMQCNGKNLADFKRDPITSLEKHVFDAKVEQSHARRAPQQGHRRKSDT